MMAWNVAELRELPTLYRGQCCDCKVDSGGLRVWVCRGAGGVTVEQYDSDRGRWEWVSGSCTSRGGADQPAG